MLEPCKRNTNRNRLKKLGSVGDEMPTFRKLPKSRQGFLAEGKRMVKLDGLEACVLIFSDLIFAREPLQKRRFHTRPSSRRLRLHPRAMPSQFCDPV